MKNLKFILLSFVALFTCQIQADNRIVYLIASPRSSMIELLRMIGERGDFKVMHIPANWAYCHAHNYTDIAKDWYREDSPTNYIQAREDILKEAEKANVFVCENTHTAKDFLAENQEFLTDSKIEFIFLLRDIHDSVISYYEKKKDYFDKLPEHQMTDSLGIKDLYNIFLKLKENGKNPLIIKSEDLYYNTIETVEKVCQYLDVPFIKESLNWKDISENFTTFTDVLGWYTIELMDCSLKWHKEAIKSTGFTKPETYKVDENDAPTFEEIENFAHREICRKAYNENLEYYNKLMEAK